MAGFSLESQTCQEEAKHLAEHDVPNMSLHQLSVEFLLKLPGRLGNVRPLLHVPGLLENALVAVALQAAEYVAVLVGQEVHQSSQDV